MRVVKYDDSIVNSMDDATLEAYLDDVNNFGNYFWKDGSRPDSSWAIPFVTGKKYKIHW